jgi:transposase
MAAPVVLRRGTPPSAHVGRLRARGGPAKVALAAGMRKLLTTPSAVTKAERPCRAAEG